MPARKRILTAPVPEFDVVRFGSDKDQSAELEITVDKSSRSGIDVRATIFGVGDGFKTHMMYADYNQVLYNKPAKRVTQKAIDKMFHEMVTDKFVEEVKKLAVAFYAEQVNKRIDRDGYEMTDEVRKFFSNQNVKLNVESNEQLA